MIIYDSLELAVSVAEFVRSAILLILMILWILIAPKKSWLVLYVAACLNHFLCIRSRTFFKKGFKCQLYQVYVIWNVPQNSNLILNLVITWKKYLEAH